MQARLIGSRVVEVAAAQTRPGRWLPVVGALAVGDGEELAYRVDGDVVRAEARPIPRERLDAITLDEIDAEEAEDADMLAIFEQLDAMRGGKPLTAGAQKTLDHYRSRAIKRAARAADIAGRKSNRQ